MDALLLELVETIAKAQYGGRWMMLFEGDQCEVVWGKCTGPELEERWRDGWNKFRSGMARTTPDMAMREAIAMRMRDIVGKGDDVEE